MDNENTFLDTLERQAKLLVELMKQRDESNKLWRQNVTTVTANIADIYNEWLR
jgi:hypothetical protein